MVDSSSERSQLVWSDEDRKVRVRLTPGVFKNAQRICEYLRGDIRITGQWQSVKLPSLLVLHLVCNGAGPTAVVTAFRDLHSGVKATKYDQGFKEIDHTVALLSDYNEMSKLHSEFLEGNQCLVVAMGEDTEVFLVPIKTNNNQDSKECVFWAYAAMRGAVAHVTEMVDTGRIPLIFDLDETLVLAHTIFSLRNRAVQLSNEISTLKAQSPSPDEPLKQLQTEEEVVNQDIAQLQFFMERDRIEINGQTIHASHEYVSGEDGQDFLRPVVRLPGRIFTRIDPKRNETSMLIRIREGWDTLSGYLRGEGTSEKRQRFKIWVCTAAERAYALEAWRLLDPSGELIPKEDVKKRLICAGKQKKSLFRTFNLGPLHEEPVPPKVMCPRKKLCPLCDGHSEMAMAIIADDRIDVWEKRNQDQILHISPFQYPCIANKDPQEIQRMLTAFQSVRSQFYFELMEQIAPMVWEALKAGFETESSYQQIQTCMQKAASISSFMTAMTPPVTPVSAPPEPPPVFNEASLKPNDRRTLAERQSKKTMLPKKRKNFKSAKKGTTNKVIPQPEDATPSASEMPSPEIQPPNPPETLVQTNPETESKPEPELSASKNDGGEKALLQIDDPMEDVQMQVDEVPEREMTEEPLEVTAVPPPPSTEPEIQPPPAPPLSDLFQLNAMVSQSALTTEAAFDMTSLIAASQQIEQPALQQLLQTVQPPAMHSLQPQNLQDGMQQPMQLLVNQLGDASNATAIAGQLRLIPGKVVLMPQSPPQAEPQQCRYTIVQLPDGQLILQPVPPDAGREPAPAPVQMQGQPLNYVIQNNPVQNTGPVPQQVQFKPWNNWVPQQVPPPPMQPMQQSHPTAGSFPRQMNIPGQMFVSSQATNLQTGIQPHQLDVPRVTMVQTPSLQQPEQLLPPFVMMQTSQQQSFDLNVEPKLEYASLPSSDPPPPQRQYFIPPPPPPPPQTPPHTPTATPGENRGFQAPLNFRSGRGRRGTGFSRGIGKRQRQPGPDQRQLPRFSPLTRSGRRLQVNNRRPPQRKAQGQKNKNQLSNKISKQQAAQRETPQDFNSIGYMAHLEDELEEQEASEEGEIRE